MDDVAHTKDLVLTVNVDDESPRFIHPDADTLDDARGGCHLEPLPHRHEGLEVERAQHDESRWTVQDRA
jgi:hypothetical protein